VTDEVLLNVAPLIKERLTTLDEAPTMAGFFFRPEVTPQREELMPKGMDAGAATGILVESISILEGLQSVAAEVTEPALRSLVDRTARPAGEVFGVLRVAVTGQKISPPLFQSMEIIGRDTVLRRLRTAVQMLAKPA
jgi:glutamyl-tRNA synthetase